MNEIFKKLKPFSGLIPAVLIVSVTAISLSGYEKPIYKAENNFKTNQTEQETIKNKDSSSSKSNKSKSKNAKEVSNKTSKTKNAPKAEKVTESGEWKDGTYTGSGTGYRGTITVQVTIKNHKITDIKVLSSSDDHPYFDNAKSLLEVIKSKQTTNVDTVSGATYSSVGLIEAVRDALSKAGGSSSSNSALPKLVGAGSGGNTSGGAAPSGSAARLAAFTESGTYKDGVYTGTATGYEGPITVRVTVSGGKISSIDVVSSSDDEPYFSNAKTLLSNIVASNSTNVDTVSGATYSSVGLINAVRNALSGAGESAEQATVNGNTGNSNSGNSNITTQPQVTQPPVNVSNSKFKDGTYEGTAKGFRGPVTVEVTIKNDKITDIQVKSHVDDDAFFNKATSLIKNIISGQTTDVDTVSGATFSSNGIIGAVNNALSKALTNETSTEPTKPSQAQTTKSTTAPTVTTATTSTVTPVPTSDNPKTTDTSTGLYNDGTYSQTVTVYADEYEDFEDYDITVTVTVKDGNVTSVTATGATGYDQMFTSNAVNGIQNQILVGKSADGLDTVSGATCSSGAIRSAVQNILKGQLRN